MDIFNNNKTYSIELDYIQAKAIYQFLTVNSYDRLYDEYKGYIEKIKAEDIEMQGSGKKLHFIENVNRLKDEDKITDTIMMNQLALGLLLEYYVRFIGGIKDNDKRSLKLNSILLYELYVTICERIIIESINYNNFENNEASKKLKLDCGNKIDTLKNISNKIEDVVGLKELSLMEIAYEKITVKSHLDLCLQEF
ncbi:TPA: hypothetical protein ACOTHD_003066 [Clostridium perfringens]